MTDVQSRGIGAAFGSLTLLLAALLFQYVGQVLPCEICIWQRWPHVIAIVIGGILLLRSVPALSLLAGLTLLVNAGIGVYHTGIERGWWPGPDSCTGAMPNPDQDAAALLDQILATPTVMCDQVNWELFGLSMASYNAFASLILAGLWFRAYASSSASQ